MLSGLRFRDARSETAMPIKALCFYLITGLYKGDFKKEKAPMRHRGLKLQKERFDLVSELNKRLEKHLQYKYGPF